MSTMNVVARFTAIAALGMTMACASTPGTQPDDMSAADHRKAAKDHDKLAGEHKGQFDPDAKATATALPADAIAPGGPFSAGVGDFYFPVTVYNPTGQHLGHSASHKQHAQQHAEAAAALEKFEEAQCQAFPKATRVVCPLLGQVDRVEDIEGGARLYLSKDVPTDAVLAHLQCHAAYARTAGREGMPGCPMYLKAISITKAGDAAVDIVSENSDTAKQIRTRSKSHAGH